MRGGGVTLSRAHKKALAIAECTSAGTATPNPKGGSAKEKQTLAPPHPRSR